MRKQLMGAYVSLAFGLNGSFDNLEQLDLALANVGFTEIKKGTISEGMRESEWNLNFIKTKIPVICRNYQEEGWISTTLDVSEELLESLEKKKCEQLVQKLTNLAIKLMQEMNLSYVFFDEEAEADIAPEDYGADYFYAITLISDKVSSKEKIRNKAKINSIEQFDGGIVLYSRFPIPHYQTHHTRPTK